MIDFINAETCVGCGTCVNSCEADVIRMDTTRKVAFIKYQDDCVLCSRCEKDCPVGAIHIGPELYIPYTSMWGM